MRLRLPWVSRARLLATEDKVRELYEQLTLAKRAERTAELVKQANADRDAWAAKVQELEDRQDALVNAAVEKAVKGIELAHARAVRKNDGDGESSGQGSQGPGAGAPRSQVEDRQATG